MLDIIRALVRKKITRSVSHVPVNVERLSEVNMASFQQLTVMFNSTVVLSLTCCPALSLFFPKMVRSQGRCLMI